MKKSILVNALLGLFIFIGNNTFAQTSKTITDEINTAIVSAEATIKKEKSLSDVDKQKFMARLQAISKSAKTRDDKEAEILFEKEYKRIADNYKRITSKSLPKLHPDKKEN